MEPILEVKGLYKEFRDFTLKNIDMELGRGYIMGLIGPNGAGKSTTIKLIMNLLKKDGGQIKIFGKDHIEHEQEIKNRIGFVFDENHFYEELTVSEMKWVVSRLYNKWDENAFKKYLRKFQLTENKKIKELSKGMKMKFSLAVALSHNAEFLIMDEPTSGLDPLIRSELLDILSEEIQDENKAVLFSTHITSDLDKIADYITFINQGELVFCESKDEIMERYALVKGGNELLDEELKKEFVGIKQSSYGFTGLTSDIHRARQVFGSSVLFEKATLEDIMLYTVRGESHVQPVN